MKGNKGNTMATPFRLDKESILERLGDDEEIYVMMIDMYLQDVDHTCEALAGALNSGDAQAVQREAHTIKGLLATFSDDAGAAEALSLEQHARLGNLASLGDAVARLQARVREVAAALGNG